jgi:hypothetical protein
VVRCGVVTAPSAKGARRSEASRSNRGGLSISRCSAQSEQTLLVHVRPEQHSAVAVQTPPIDLQVDGLHVGNSPPPHRPEQHSPLLLQKLPSAVHVGPPLSGTPASGGGGGLNVPHFSLPPSFGSGEQIPPQQSSGVWHISPSGLHVQSPHMPLLQMLLQHSAVLPHVSPMTLHAKPLSHVLLF